MSLDGGLVRPRGCLQHQDQEKQEDFSVGRQVCLENWQVF